MGKIKNYDDYANERKVAKEEELGTLSTDTASVIITGNLKAVKDEHFNNDEITFKEDGDILDMSTGADGSYKVVKRWYDYNPDDISDNVPDEIAIILNPESTEIVSEKAMFENAINPLPSFGHSDLSGMGGGATEPKDPTMSHDAWDMHKNNVRDRVKRFSDILMNVFAAGDMTFSQQLTDIIQDLTIVRIFRNNNGLLNIYLKFFYEEEVFYGSFKDWGGINEPKFKSKILTIPVIGRFKENTVRTVNVLKQILEEWFRPEIGDYVALKDIKVYDWMGNICCVPKGGKVYVEDVIDDETPEIELVYSDKKYKINKLDYFYFHWWFDPIEKREFYL